jgi:hypothetical protein
MNSSILLFHEGNYFHNDIIEIVIGLETNKL